MNSTKSKAAKNGTNGRRNGTNGGAKNHQVPRGNQLVQTAPAAQGFRVNTAQPRGAMAKGKWRLENEELLISSVLGSTGFTATKYSINPGLASRFSWLSSAAQNYEKYAWIKFAVEYVPTDGSTATKGRIYLAFDYDAVDAAPATKAAMLAYASRSEGLTWQNTWLHFNRSDAFDGVQRKRVRCGPVAGDLLLYDGLSVIVATDGMADTSAVGEIYVHYEIELSSPQVDPATPVPQGLSVFNLSASQALTNNVLEAIDFDETIIDGMGFGLPTVGVFTPPCGTYKVDVDIGCKNTANENTQVDVLAYKNGAAMVPPQSGQTSLAPGKTNGVQQLSFTFYTQLNGTDTFEIQVQMIGAAGTLTLTADCTRIAFTVV